MYTTTQTHSLGLKAGLILGLTVYAIPVRSEDDYSLRGHDLREVIENDKAEGKHPFVISEPHLLSLPCPPRFKLSPKLVPSEPHRAVRSTTLMRLPRHVSLGEFHAGFGADGARLDQSVIIRMYGSTWMPLGQARLLPVPSLGNVAACRQ